MWRGPLAYGQATLTAIRSGTRDHKRNLAARAAGESRSQLGRGASEQLLVQLGQLPGDGDLAIRKSLGQHGQGFFDPVRRLEGDREAPGIPERFEETTQLPRLARQ